MTKPAPIIEIRFLVEEDFHGLRLDHYLKRKIRRLSRTRIQQVIRTQLVGPGGRTMKPSSPVAAGDEILIRRPARPEPPAPSHLPLLHGDDHVRVFDKPAGMAMHATARYYFTTLARLLRERYPDDGLQICHRLDRETSGCVVVARGKRAAARLKMAFEQRRVDKTYLALVHGAPAWDERDVDLPLALAPPRHLNGPDRPPMQIRMQVDAAGLSAQTHVRVVARGRDVALVECRPRTGRQHQIRAHLAALGHPVVGDKLYAHGEETFVRYCDMAPGALSDAEIAAELGMARQALHAARVTFPHPETGDPVTVDSPLPEDMRAFFLAHS
ncbi:MAG TPA: RluA family pseudouridine synthase [Haliangiales bacterium]|nr:RluA family pseudouridine synthase [Haliangiales bacterium]